MNRNEFIKRLFNKGKEAGLSEMEVNFIAGESFSIRVFKGEIDDYKLSDTSGISLRAIYDGSIGYAYTEIFDEDSIKILIENAIENAVINDSDEKEVIYEGSGDYKKINNFNPALQTVKEDRKISFVKDLEKYAMSIDKRMAAVQYCTYSQGSSKSLISNTKKLELSEKSNVVYAYMMAVVKEKDETKTGMGYMVERDFDKLDYKKIAKEAVAEAVAKLGAESIGSGEYPVILRNDAAADLLESYLSIFNAENVQKNMSLLKGRLNMKIASGIIRLVDDPHMENGYASRGYDAEGVATRFKYVIQDGILKTYLYNLKAALKDGVESTGNAVKGSYKSTVGIAPSNMYIKPGQISRNDAVLSIDKGLFITELEGLHAGVNSVSGDFSLSAQGFLIENGRITRPVYQITIAGNFLELLNSIEAVCNDLKFGLPGSCYIGSPSLKIKKLSVAGNKNKN